MNHARQTTRIGHRRTWLAVVIAIHCGFTASYANDTSKGNRPPLIQPTSVHELPQDASLSDFIANEDGTRLFGTYTYRTVNAWEVLVYVWPELAAMLGVMIAGIVGWRLMRHRNLRRKIGVRYCRSCNYELTGVIAQHCPECGRDLNAARAVAVGRKTPVQRTMLLVMASASLFAVLLVYFLDPPRRGSVSNRFKWPSSALHTILSDQDVVDRFSVETVRQLIQYDTENSSIVRMYDEVRIDAGSSVNLAPNQFKTSISWHQLQVSADHNRLVALHNNSVVAWEVHTGRKCSPFETGGDTPLSICLSKDGSLLLGASNPFDVRSWSLADGSETSADDVELIRPPSEVTNPDDPPFAFFWDINDKNTQLFVFGWQIVDEPLTRSGNTIYRVDVQDPNQILFRPITGQGQDLAIQPPPHWPAMSHWGVGVDRHSGYVILIAESFVEESGSQTGIRLALHAPSSNRWIAELDVSSLGQMPTQFTASTDGVHFFVCGPDRSDSNEHQSLLLIFDLPQH